MIWFIILLNIFIRLKTILFKKLELYEDQLKLNYYSNNLENIMIFFLMILINHWNILILLILINIYNKCD